MIDKLLESFFYIIPGTNFVSSLIRFYTLFWIALYYEFRSPDFGLSLKRIVVVVTLFFGFPWLLMWNHFGFLLDDLFYPDWRKSKVYKPCFIVGNARSGTTWLHRLVVTSMEEKFTTFKTWEIVFAPSVVWKRLFMTLWSWDSSICNSFFFQILCRLEMYLIPKSQLHEIGLQLAEEDEWLMMHISFAQLLCFFFPCAGVVLGKLIMFDLPPEGDNSKLSKYHRELMFTFYKECIQRHLYARYIMRGLSIKDIVFVSKNPAFTLRLESLYYMFPDAKVVCLLRDPVESVPSMVSYIAKVYHAFSAPRIVYPNARDLLQYCITHYQYPLGRDICAYYPNTHALVTALTFFYVVTEQLNDRRPCNQWSFVKYSLLKNDLQNTLLGLLERLEIASPSSCSDKYSVQNLKSRLDKEQSQTNRFKSSHKHSVKACCGMDEAELKRILKVVYDTHEFE